MGRSLRDCYAKIDRADEHIINLALEVDAFLRTKPYLIAFDRDPKQGLVLRSTFDESITTPKLIRFGIMTGEIAHHLRSSLNHLVIQLSRNRPRRDTKTEFPIFLTRLTHKSFENKTRDKIKFVRSGKAKTVIENAQPYKGRGSNDPLWIVHALDIRDKHHVILDAGGATEFYRGSNPDGSISRDNPFAVFPLWIRLKNGAVVAKPTQPPMDMDFKAVYQILLPKVGRITPEPVVPCLTQVSEYIRGLVGSFEDFL